MVSREEKEKLKNNEFNFVGAACERACHKEPDRLLPELCFEKGNVEEGQNMQKGKGKALEINRYENENLRERKKYEMINTLVCLKVITILVETQE